MEKLDTEKLGERFRALRGARTQDQIAEMLGIHWQAYRRLEKGETKNPSFEDLVNVGLVFGLTPNQMAALADLWRLSDSRAAKLEEGLSYLRNGLLELPEDRQDDILNLLVTVVKLALDEARVKVAENPDDAVLPDWARQFRYR